MQVNAATVIETGSIRRITRDEWATLAPRFRDLSYRQCGAFADAAASQTRSSSEFVGIFRDRELIGLANVRVKRVSLLPLGIAYSNYGPIIALDRDFCSERYSYCLNALKREYAHNRGMILRVIPPIRGGHWLHAQRACLQAQGFHPYHQPRPRDTFIVDLSVSLSDMRKNLDAKWRSDLVKAEKLNIEVTRSVAVSAFDTFEPIFAELVQSKSFTATQDVSFFRAVQQRSLDYEKAVVHLAWHHGELVAGHVGTFVGDTAVYLLGASTTKGRDLRASYLLQWSVIEYAKSLGIPYYDLGGVDPQENPNVYRFKKRLNGRRIIEVGTYEVARNAYSHRLIHLLEHMYHRVARR